MLNVALAKLKAFFTNSRRWNRETDRVTSCASAIAPGGAKKNPAISGISNNE